MLTARVIVAQRIGPSGSAADLVLTTASNPSYIRLRRVAYVCPVPRFFTQKAVARSRYAASTGTFDTCEVSTGNEVGARSAVGLVHLFTRRCSDSRSGTHRPGLYDSTLCGPFEYAPLERFSGFSRSSTIYLHHWPRPGHLTLASWPAPRRDGSARSASPPALFHRAPAPRSSPTPGRPARGVGVRAPGELHPYLQQHDVQANEELGVGTHRGVARWPSGGDSALFWRPDSFTGLADKH